MKFPKTSDRLFISYGLAVVAVAVALLVREILGVVLGPYDFMWILPLASVYVASVFGGEGPGLLSIGLVLVGIHFIHVLPTHFPDVPRTESIVLQTLFVSISLAVWYLASARGRAVAIASSAATERERTIIQLEELLSMVSHDMRTPLNSMNLILYSLEKITEGGDARFQRPLATAHQQVARILNLVNRLLEPMKTEGFFEQPRLEDFDLGGLVKEVVESAAPEIQAANCLLELDIEAVKGRWDKFRVERVLTNLVSNAIKHAPGTTIIIRLQAKPGIARLSVQDHGPGIAEEDREMIFRRFVTAGSPQAKRESLGLGLYIARRIVEAHDGQIVVESEIGRGATFIVTLPIRTMTARLSSPSHGPARLSPSEALEPG
jgi:signal transduction histidine kinase